MAGITEKTIAGAARALELMVASERWARANGLLQSIDPRAKIVAILTAIIACSLARDPIILAALYAAATALAVLSRIGVGAFTRRVWVFIPLFTGIVALPAIVMVPGAPLAAIGPFHVTREGLGAAAFLVLRVSACVSFSMLLVLTTPWNDLFRALRTLRVPAAVVTLLSLCIRYLVLLLRTFSELFTARRSRVMRRLPIGGEISFLSRSAGFLFLRSLSFAEGVHLAVVSRGGGDPTDGRAGPPERHVAPELQPRPDLAVFELAGIRFAYAGGIPGVTAERLLVPHGACTILLGPNGSGKSTLLAILDGLLFPQAGTVRAFGEELSERALSGAAANARFRARVALLFQDPDIQCFSPTVREELSFGPRQRGMSAGEIDARVREALAALGIEGIAERYPYDLSGGEKKRVAIASILTVDPEVYLLDEPTANLDPATEGALIDILASLAAAGKTLVVATQDLVLASHIGDFAVVLGAQKRPLFAGPLAAALGDAKLLAEAGLTHAHRRPHRAAPAAFRHSHYTEDSSK